MILLGLLVVRTPILPKRIIFIPFCQGTLRTPWAGVAVGGPNPWDIQVHEPRYALAPKVVERLVLK
jgi:hypothetical protein